MTVHELKQRGFSLIELMVVVSIIAILLTFVVPKIFDKPDQARLVQAKHNIKALESALQFYRNDNYDYPSTEQGLQALVEQPSGDPEAPNWQGYMDKLPKDPWGGDYQYLYPGSHGSVDIYTLGRDKRLGGEGVNADIGNWDL